MRRNLDLSAVFVAIIVLVTFAAAIRAGTPDTQIAQDHLRQLGTAIRWYLSDYNERLDDPIRLWQFGYVTEPTVFWNPGDTDPQPWWITNSVPNAWSSARISYDFATCLRPCEGILPDEPIVWDNTPDNNGGAFSSFHTLDGAIYTSPPNISPIPTNVAITHARLRRLWVAVGVYALENGGLAPTELLDIHPSPYAMSPRNYWNPGDSDPLPTDISTDEPDAINSARISFDYLVAGQDWDSMDPETIVLADNTSTNNAGYGVNVVNRRGFVRFVAAGTLGDADDDGDIDFDDYAKMQNCFTMRPYGAIFDNTCRIMDWDGDDEVTLWDDLANFLPAMTGPLSK